jgi:hypothetical protein
MSRPGLTPEQMDAIQADVPLEIQWHPSKKQALVNGGTCGTIAD